MTTDEQKVAWVAGGSRGIGRGIAVALGEAGWQVWVTARSSSNGGLTSHLLGTVESVALEVTSVGGFGIPRLCDHGVDEQVAKVAAEIAASGPLHLLVNNVWRGYERLNAGQWDEWIAPMWQQPLELFDAMFAHGVRAHCVASALAAPALIASAPAAVVTVSMEVGTAHTSDHGVAYSMAKAADDRLAVALAGQLVDSGVASLSVHPGLVRTEGVKQFAEFFDFTDSESPEGVGRAVVALVTDPAIMSMSGTSVSIRQLAERYGVDITT